MKHDQQSLDESRDIYVSQDAQKGVKVASMDRKKCYLLQQTENGTMAVQRFPFCTIGDRKRMRY